MANHMNGPGRWTEAETQEALRLRAEGATRRQIAERVGRSPASVKSRFAFVALSPERLEKRRAGIVRTDSIRRAKIRDGGTSPVTRPRPTPAQLAEREQRFSHIPTISQMLLGDPLPGQSALDKRMGA